MQLMVAPHVFTVPLLYDGGAIAYAHPNIRDALGSGQTVRTILMIDLSNVLTYPFHLQFRVHMSFSQAPPPEFRNAVNITLTRTKANPIVAT